MTKQSRPWLIASAVCALAFLVRYLLIQPPQIAHQCDAGAGPWWCAIRLAIILSYSGWGLGYASLATCVLALWYRRVLFGALALSCGTAAIVLYCYEPGALAMVVGALVLVRAQNSTRRFSRPDPDQNA